LAVAVSRTRALPALFRDRPAGCGVAFVLLLLATDLSFRSRDPTLALEGVIDAEILFELGVWAVVSVWLAFGLLPRARLDVETFTETGPVLRTLMAVAGLFGLSSVLAGGVLPLVRGGQYVILVALALLAYRTTWSDPEAAERFWRVTRRALWVTVAVLAVVSLALAQVVPAWTAEIGPSPLQRYAMFATHPVTSGGMLWLAIVVLASSWLGSEDPWLRRGGMRWLAGGAFAGLFVLLLASKARGALFATLAALAIITLITPHRTRRGVAVLASITGLGLLLAGMGAELVREVVIRGQTTDQLLSLTGRTRLFAVSYQLFLERPFFGHGYHAARSIYLERVYWAGHSHNALAETAVNTGIVGLLLVTLLIGLLLVRLLRAWRHAPHQQRLWAGEGLAVLAYVLLLGMISPSFAGAPGFEAAALVWAVLLADLAHGREPSHPVPDHTSQRSGIGGRGRPSHAGPQP
jgi:exopolysaccharide production protein ExoQ